MGLVEFATSPWGQTVPIHISWFLIWVAAIGGLAFLIVHAIWVQFIARKEAPAEPVSPYERRARAVDLRAAHGGAVLEVAV